MTPAELLARDLTQQRAFEAWQRELALWDEPPPIWEVTWFATREEAEEKTK